MFPKKICSWIIIIVSEDVFRSSGSYIFLEGFLIPSEYFFLLNLNHKFFKLNLYPYLLTGEKNQE